MYVYQIMSNNFGFIDIILLAMIAGFIILRLRNILGRKTGHEGKVTPIYEEKKYDQFKPQIKIAYETILIAFAKSEKEKLKRLLTKEIYQNFAQAIDERNKEGIKSELTFIGIKESKLEKYEKVEDKFSATAKIVCEIISVKRNKKNEIIEGDPDKIKTVIDHWKFSKSASSQNPNWFLAEIISK